MSYQLQLEERNTLTNSAFISSHESLMIMNTNTPLVNLALLEAMKGMRITDEIDIFIPYLALSISKIENEYFDIQDVKEKFKSEFSITPPEPALQTILTRAKKRGYIGLYHSKYFKIPEKLNETIASSNSKRIEIQRSLKTLIIEFKSYSYDRHNTVINDHEAESFLYKYISTNISAFVDVLSGNALNVKTKIRNKDYLTASFIAYLNKEKTEKLLYLDNLVKGTLLANYITCADKITSKSTFSNISIYLDSPIVLGLLGYSGSTQKRSLSEFLSLLISLETNVCVFDITIYEIERLFGAWKDGLEKKKYSEFNPTTLQLLRAKGLDSIALETEKSLIESKVEQLGIAIKNNFIINKNFQCDEIALEEHLRVSGLKNDLRHDVQCISRIHNSREENQIKSFNSKFSIFATLNSTLERSVYKYFSTEYSTKSIPIVSSEKWLATILWLKKPNLFNELPSNLLLSHAYSTMYSDDKFWNSFITRLSDLKKRGEVSEKDFTIVRWDKSLIDKIHDLSIENGDDFKSEDIFEVIESIKKEHSEDKDKELLLLETAKNEEISEETKKRQAAEIKNKNYHAKIKAISKRTSHGIASLISLIIVCFIIKGLYISTPNVPLFPKEMVDFNTSWATLPIAILLILTLLGLLFGTSVKDLYKYTQTRIESRIIGFFENQA